MQIGPFPKAMKWKNYPNRNLSEQRGIICNADIWFKNKGIRSWSATDSTSKNIYSFLNIINNCKICGQKSLRRITR